jgi:outer membrane protein
MKKLFKSALIAGCILLMGSFAKAQSKIGYINFQQLVTGTNSFKGIQASIDAYQKQFSETLQGMQGELQQKGADYESKRATMTDAVRTKTETELQDLQKRIQDYNNTATNQVQQKYNELTKPLLDKLKAAINQVAKEKGYTYVIDSSQTELLVAPDADDLMASVKAKIGPDVAAPAAAAPVKK